MPARLVLLCYVKLLLPRRIFVPNGDLNWLPHIFNAINISNHKQTISCVHLFSSVGWHLRGWQHMQAALLHHINQTEADSCKNRRLESVFLRLTANKFSYKSIQNQHFQLCWDCWKAEAAITGWTAISQPGNPAANYWEETAIFTVSSQKNSTGCSNYVPKSQAINLSKCNSPAE